MDMRKALRALLLFGTILTVGYASGPPIAWAEDPAPADGDGAPAVEASASLEMISVVGKEDAILIETSGSVEYSAFRLSDPPRLVIDMPGTDVSGVADMQEVNNNYITLIETSTSGEGAGMVGRVEIGLRDGITHDVKSGEDSILIDLKREIFVSIDETPEEAAFEEAATEEDVAVEESLFADDVEGELPIGATVAVDDAVEDALVEEELLGVDEPSDAELEAEMVDLAEAPADEIAADETEGDDLSDATTLRSVDVTASGGDTVVTLVADGAMGNYSSFGLDSPARYVVDIWGIDSDVEESVIDVDGPIVRTVRVGAHPEMVRIVFDSSAGLFHETNIDKVGDTMTITFKGGVEVAASEDVTVSDEIAYDEPVVEEVMEEIVEEVADELVEVAVEPTFAEEVFAAPVAIEEEEEEAMTIEDLTFRKVKRKARLRVATSGRPDYKLKESEDGKTLTLDIFGAVIPEELKATLDAKALNTPVITISSYQATTDPPKVRVLIKLKERTDFKIKKFKRSVRVEFPLKRAETASSDVAVEEGLDETGAEPFLFGAPTIDEFGTPATKYMGKRVNLNMTDTNVADILKLLAEEAGKNIIISDEVTGTVTLSLTDVPLDQAFDIIFKIKGLDKEEEGNVMRVATAASLAKERQELIAARLAEERLEELVTEYIRISYDIAGDLESQVSKLLKDRERGEVTSHAPTNTLIIKDVAAGIEGILEYIRKVDIPSPQVLIEARIVRAENTFARDLGVQWGAMYNTQVGDGGDFQVYGANAAPVELGWHNTQLISDDEETAFYQGTPHYAVNLPAAGSAGSLGAMGFSLGRLTGSPLVLDLRLSAGEARGNVRTISRPRIVTMDNVSAKITQGQQIPFETSSASGTTTQWIPAGLSLEVTPHITPDGSVIMDITVSKNSLGSFRSSSGQPGIDTKEATTKVLVKDGETTVIGGIIETDNLDSKGGVPFLKDLPFVGWLFKNKSKSESQTELLVFITPTIIRDAEVY